MNDEELKEKISNAEAKTWDSLGSETQSFFKNKEEFLLEMLKFDILSKAMKIYNFEMKIHDEKIDEILRNENISPNDKSAMFRKSIFGRI